MRSLLWTCLVCVLLFLLAPFVLAQGAGSSGVLTGVVTDAQGAKVANAQVTVVQPERGIKRTATTDEHGGYRITSLPPDTYSVSIEAPGMARQTYDGVALRVGEFASVDVHLGVVTVKNEAARAASQPVVDTERTSQADVIGRRELQDLPANGRDYLSYAQLSPGVTDSTRVAGNLDYRMPQAPQSMISVNGSSGQGNGYTVNAGETANDLGGARLSAGQDAIQEFQVNRAGYGAELGSAGFVNINAVPRSGSNHVHGGAFGFFQGDALNARNPFAFDPALHVGDPWDTTSQGTPVQNGLSQQTFGANIGGPFQADKTYYFFSYEGLRRSGDASVPLLTDSSIFAPTVGQQTIITGLANLAGNPSVPCLTGQPALPAATCATVLTNLLTINPVTSPLNDYLVNLFEANGGLIPSSADRDAGTIRLDHQLNSDNALHFLYDLGRDDVSNPNLYGLTGASRGESFHQLDHTVFGSWDHQFSGTMNNELRAQFSYAKFDVATNSPGQVGIDINGYGSFGRGLWGPSNTTMKRYDFADDFTWTKGRHTLRAGAELLVHDDRMDQQYSMAGRFEFGSLLGGVVSPCLQVPAACGLTAINPTVISGLQAFSFGLPQSYQQGFGDRPGDSVVQNTNPLTALYLQDSWKMASNFTLNYGVRYEYDSQPNALNSYAKAFAPRVGFAWDPFRDHKTVVRGSYGMFYAPVDHQVDFAAQALSTNQIAQVYTPLSGVPGIPGSDSATVFQTLFAGGQIQCTTPAAGAPGCITPADIAPFGLTVSHAGAVPGSILYSVDPNFQNALTQQGTFGIERQIWDGWTISANYIFAHTTHIARTRDVNLLDSPVLGGFFGVPYQNWSGGPCATPGVCFVDPTIMQNNLIESRGGAVYHAGTFEVRKQFSDHYSLVANYTYSHAIDDVSGFNTDLQAFNQVSLASERARSDFDQRHKFDFYMVAESPWTWRSSEGWHKVFADFVLSPELVANSGHPYNTLLGFDLNHDRHDTTDRFPGVSRNAGIGPALANVNLRISRSFPVGEQFKLQFLAESFNLFNHSNFTSVNNIVLDPYNFTLPKNGCQMGNIQAASYACTSATDGRTLQFGARISF